MSRATANKALASLVSVGLLEFRKGIGTFVRQATISYDLRSIVSFTEKARAAGKTPRTLLRTFGKLKACEVEPQIADRLKVAGSALLWELDRVRAIDGIPGILEHRFNCEFALPSTDSFSGRGVAVSGRDRIAPPFHRGGRRNGTSCPVDSRGSGAFARSRRITGFGSRCRRVTGR